MLAQCIGGLLAPVSVSHAATGSQPEQVAACEGHHTDSVSDTGSKGPALPDGETPECCDTLSCLCLVGHMPALFAHKHPANLASTDLGPSCGITPAIVQRISEFFRPPISALT
jgi:hypothetical protein